MTPMTAHNAARGLTELLSETVAYYEGVLESQRQVIEGFDKQTKALQLQLKEEVDMTTLLRAELQREDSPTPGHTPGGPVDSGG